MDRLSLQPLKALMGRLPLFQTRSLQALKEAMVVQFIVMEFGVLGILLLAHALPASAMVIARLTLLCGNFLAYAWLFGRWRFRPTTRSRKRQFLVEMAGNVTFFLSLFLCDQLFTFVVSAIVHVILPADQMYYGELISPFMERMPPLPLIIYGGIFGALRLEIQLMRSWNRLRRTHLRWSLTHAHLMVVLIGAGILGTFVTVVLVILSLNSEPRSLLSIVAVAIIMLFCTLVALLCVLPPSALFSYIFTRRLTQRLERLASATTALREGNYNIRVDVDGLDEIASLQANFNAMAIDLERTMRELKEERDNVARLLQARRELIANVSHELRTPVATVRSYLESSLSSWQRDVPPATLRQDMQIMEEQTVRLQSLINDLFTLARAEVGRLDMRIEPTDVALLVQRVVDTTAPIAWRGSRVELVMDVEAVQPQFPLLLADSNRLEQILHNLIHNAIRHTPPGGIIVVGATVEEQMGALHVKDTGEGIAADELERIWERFYRASNSRAQPASGTGLGLAIVKELAESMGGSVAVESVVQQGTCFTVRLPLAVPVTPLDMDMIARMQTSPLFIDGKKETASL